MGGVLRNNFSEILIEVDTLKKHCMHRNFFWLIPTSCTCLCSQINDDDDDDDDDIA